MPSNYPTGYDSFTTRTDGTDKVMASHVNFLQDILAAIQSTLGLSPQGGFATVAARLAALAGVATDVLWDAKGDLAVGTGANTAAKLGVGSAGQKLTANTSESTGLKWIPDTCGLNVIIGDGQNVVSTGVKGFVEIPYGFYIDSVRLVADAAGSIVIDVWTDNYANFPPTVADSICSTAKPTLSSAQKYENSTLTGWTRQLSSQNWLGFNVDSATTVKQVTLSIRGHKTDNS